MSTFSAIALFCDDAREEKAGSETLVGVLPDTIQVPAFPGRFPRLTIYVRLHIFGLEMPPTISVRVLDGADTLFIEHAPTRDELAEMFNASKASTVGYFGFVIRFGLAPFPVPQAGTIRVFVIVDEKELLAGAISVSLAENAAT